MEELIQIHKEFRLDRNKYTNRLQKLRRSGRLYEQFLRGLEYEDGPDQEMSEYVEAILSEFNRLLQGHVYLDAEYQAFETNTRNYLNAVQGKVPPEGSVLELIKTAKKLHYELREQMKSVEEFESEIRGIMTRITSMRDGEQ